VRTLWRTRPLFEFFLFLKTGGEALLADTIDSLAGQCYDIWRLSIFAPTSSPEPDFILINNELQSSPTKWARCPHSPLREGALGCFRVS
jgi:hypothetical protein